LLKQGVTRALPKIAIYIIVDECAPSDKRRQKATNFPCPKATNCGKFVAAFCRILPLGFERRFFVTDTLGDGV
jgi:hypothetical protein